MSMLSGLPPLTPERVKLLCEPPEYVKDAIRTMYRGKTPEDGVILLERWPEGYVLWHHGEIVWKEWAGKHA